MLAGETWVDIESAELAIEEAEAVLGAGDARGAWGPANLALGVADRGLLPGHEASWLDVRRRELDEVALRALEVIAGVGLALGGSELAAADRAAKRLIDRQPFRESGYSLLMRAHEARGDAAAALRVYDQLRVLLREELGTVPGSALRQRHRALLDPPLADAGTSPTGPAAARIERPPLPAPLHVRRRFVGRERLLAVLMDEWREAIAHERGGAMLVAGEAGIGKTRAVAELAWRVHAEGAIVLYGRCDIEGIVPYQPFLEALTRVASVLPDAVLGAAGALVSLVPALAGSAPVAAPGERIDRFQLFESMRLLLAALASAAPTLLLIDDLHWADRATLQMLRHLLRVDARGQMLVLGAYRPGEVAPGGDLASLLVDAPREDLAGRVRVEGMDQGEVTALIAAVAGHAPSTEFAAALHAETAGNPFFVGEVLAHLAETGTYELRDGRWESRLPLAEIGIPSGVHEAIERRLAHLGEPTGQRLRIAAVLGGEFTLEALALVTEVQEEELLGTLERATAAQLLLEVPGAPGRYSFAHALVRGALYESIGAARRGRLHERAGTALEALYAEELDLHLGELARHFTRAGDPRTLERAIDYSVRAGHRARAQLAHGEAAEHLRDALRLIGPDGDPQRRLFLLLDLAGALNAASDAAAAKATFRAAFMLAQQLGQPEALARAALGFAGSWLSLGTVDRERMELLEQALQAVGNRPGAARARLLSRMALEVYYDADGPARRESLSHEAVQIARELQDRGALVRALMSRRVALAGSPDLEERLAVTGELLTLAEGEGATEMALWGHTWRATDLIERGDVAAAYEQFGEYERLARVFRRPGYMWHVSLFEAMRALLEGRYSECEAHGARGRSAAHRAHDPNGENYFGILTFMLRRDQGRLAEVEPVVRAFAEGMRTVPAWSCGLTLLEAELGRDAAARDTLDELSAEDFASLPLDINWLPGMAWLALASSLIGDRPSAAALYAVLEPHAERCVTTGHPIFCLGSVHHFLGITAACSGRHTKAKAHLQKALERHEAFEAHPLVARTRCELTWSLAALGCETDAEIMFALAQEQSRALGLRGLEPRLVAVRTELDARAA